MQRQLMMIPLLFHSLCVTLCDHHVMIQERRFSQRFCQTWLSIHLDSLMIHLPKQCFCTIIGLEAPI